MSTAYFNADGRLIVLVRDTEDQAAPSGAVFTATVDDTVLANDIYYADDQVKLRGTMPLVISRNRVLGIPVGTTAYFDETTATVNDGSLVFASNVEEEINVVLQHDHFKTVMTKVQTGP